MKIGGNFIKTYTETEKIGPYLAIPLVATTSGLKKYDLNNYSRLGLYYVNDILYPLVHESEAKSVSKSVTERIISDKKFVKKVCYDIRYLKKQINSFLEKTSVKSLRICDRNKLWFVYKNLQDLIRELWGLVWIFIATDFPFEYFTPILKKRIVKSGFLSEDANKLISIFQEPDIFRLNLGRYYRLIRKSHNQNTANIKKEFYWIHWNYDEGEELTGAIIKKELREARGMILESRNAIIAVGKKEYKLSLDVWRLLDDVFLMSHVKAEAKEVVNKISYHANLLFNELEKRFGVDADLLRKVIPEEMEKYLIYGQGIDTGQLIKRRKESVFIVENESIKVFVNKNDIRRFFIKNKRLSSADKKYFGGQPVYAGKAHGSVCIIKGAREAKTKKFFKGSILVSVNTSPNMIATMRKAAAIITDIGGITSHAAILSRELKIPCIIGTKIATKVLKDGDLVEVDAEKGVVKILKRAL